MSDLSFSFETRVVTRRFPLTISRGTAGPVETLFVSVSDGSLVGVGEGMRCFGALVDIPTVCQPLLKEVFDEIGQRSVLEIYRAAVEREIPMPGVAALDCALWDLKAKQAGMPLYRLLGLPRPSVPTSVTVGIEPTEVVLERVKFFCELVGANKVKVKLGSPEGIDRDKEIFLAAKEAAAPFGAGIRVDANGGWSVESANAMIPWLAERGCDYVEQPLVFGAEEDFKYVTPQSRLPIFLDESIRTSEDVLRLRDTCHGVNLKLMKSGGITEGLHLLRTAKTCGLQTMIGCMSDSSIAIAAGAALSGLCDHVDLDNHFNLLPDPASGLLVENGVVVPPETPGHGAVLTPA